MKVYLLSTSVDEKSYKRIQHELNFFNPAQKFYQLLKNGITDNGIEVRMYSMLSTEFSKYISKTEDHNVFYYNEKKNRYKTCVELSCSLSKEINPCDDVIIVDGQAYWALRAALMCKKNTGCKVIEMVTDFPHHVYSYSSSKHNDIFAIRLLKYAYTLIKLSYMRKADAYILLTQMMSEIIGEKKPYTIIEGFSQINPITLKIDEIKLGNERKKIVYLGSLNDQSGIINLVKACLMIKSSDFDLWIYGDGYAKNYIIEVAESDDRFHYGGVVSLERVYEIEQSADILINPRPTKKTFNRYSFPSKILEYMSSGTAVCCTKLECFSDEYEPFIFWISDTSIYDMKKDLENVLSLSKKDLMEKGELARCFALKYKAPSIQAKKILDLANNLIIR